MNWKHAFMHSEDFNKHVEDHVKDKLKYCNYGWLLVWFITVMFMLSQIVDKKNEIDYLKSKIENKLNK